MALHHGRSLSLPSASHPAISEIDLIASRLRSSEETSSSLSSMGCRINGLRNLYKSIDDQLHIQHIISEECDVDEYVKLLDACSRVKDVISLAKQDLRELLSAVRRKDAHGLDAYLASRKQLKKMIQKSLKNLRRCTSASLDKASQEMSLVYMLKEAESVAFSLLESLLAYTSGSSVQERKSSWSLISKLMHSKKVSDEENEFNKVDSFLQQYRDNELVHHLKEMDSSIEVVEEELESIFRQLIKTRVSLLNILNQ